LAGFLNTKYINQLTKMLNPTLHFQSGDFRNLPFDKNQDYSDFGQFGKNNVDISKKDWDAHETSWDFQHSPLLSTQPTLEQAYHAWAQAASRDFFQLHTNEEELNRIFIGIYGLEEELTPEVPLKDITILQEELDGKDLEAVEPAFREKGA